MPSRAKRIVKTARGFIIQPPEPRTKKKCAICKKDMLVAKGQIAKYHKSCRKLRNNKSLKNV